LKQSFTVHAAEDQRPLIQQQNEIDRQTLLKTMQTHSDHRYTGMPITLLRLRLVYF